MRKLAYLLALLLVGSCSESSTNTDQGANDNIEPEDSFGKIAYVNYAKAPQNADIRRGRIVDAAVEGLMDGNKSLMEHIQSDIDLKMRISILPKDINQYSADYPKDIDSNTPFEERLAAFEKCFRSYRSKDNGQFGTNGESEEFYEEDGEVKVHVNKDYLALCRKVLGSGQELIIQCSGVPVEGTDEGKVKHLFDYSPDREFHWSARHYPFPHPKDREASGNVIADYMIKLSEELGEEYKDKLIFCGNQEPSHTPGYPINDPSSWKKDWSSVLNISEYPLVWKPTAERLKAAGLRSGLSQLNQAYKTYYASFESISENNVPYDFYTLQQYKGWKNKEVLAEVFKWAGECGIDIEKKLLFNRYDIDDGVDDNGDPGAVKETAYNTSPGIVTFLNAEKILMEHSNLMYGYCLFVGSRNYDMLDLLLLKLNEAPYGFRELNFDAYPGVYGFALCDDSKYKATLFLWCDPEQDDAVESDVEHDIDLAIKNYNVSFTSVKATMFDDKDINENCFMRWNPSTQRINDLKIGNKQVYIIELS